MSMTEGQMYRCQNRDCGCEVTVIKPSIECNTNPGYSCGWEMKKPYSKPVLRILSPDVEFFASVKNNRE